MLTIFNRRFALKIRGPACFRENQRACKAKRFQGDESDRRWLLWKGLPGQAPRINLCHESHQQVYARVIDVQH